MNDIKKKIEAVKKLGAVLLIHDFDDFGKFDRLHHWMYGALLYYGAKIFEFLVDLGVLDFGGASSSARGLASKSGNASNTDSKRSRI